MNLAVVGLGLIGGSLALDLQSAGLVSRVVGVDADGENAQLALKLGLCAELETLEAALPAADLVVLAIPVDAIAKILPAVLDAVSENATVVDMGSTKELIGRAVQGHARRKNFVASHPMAGTEFSGPNAAVRGLFSKRAAVICDGDLSGLAQLKVVERMYEVLGMRTTKMSSSEHDLHVAYVSHLSHISSFVLANAVLDKEKDTSAIFDLASGGFESTVRLAKSSPAMWTPIFEQNQKHVSDALGAYIDHLTRFKKTLDEGRFDETRKLMEGANEIRRVLNRLAATK